MTIPDVVLTDSEAVELLGLLRELRQHDTIGRVDRIDATIAELRANLLPALEQIRAGGVLSLLGLGKRK